MIGYEEKKFAFGGPKNVSAFACGLRPTGESIVLTGFFGGFPKQSVAVAAGSRSAFRRMFSLGQALFFHLAPRLHLRLAPASRNKRRKFLIVDDSDWPPRSGVFGTLAFVVPMFPRSQIVARS